MAGEPIQEREGVSLVSARDLTRLQRRRAREAKDYRGRKVCRICDRFIPRHKLAHESPTPYHKECLMVRKELSRSRRDKLRKYNP